MRNDSDLFEADVADLPHKPNAAAISVQEVSMP